MIVEMRTYRTKSGMRSRFLELFERRTIPEHARLGMPIAGPWPCIDDENVFFFMRGFAGLEERVVRKEAFYEGSLWKDELEDVLMPMLERYDVAVVDLPEGSIDWNHR